MKRKTLGMTKILNSVLWDLPSSTNLTYMWNFGSMLGTCLMLQIISGLTISMFYTSMDTHAFENLIKITKEIWGGNMIRLIHASGASMFFLFIYMHLFRNMYYMSSSNKKTWISGVSILLLLMAISFLGYVLPWGQMSYWGVAVITNLFSIVPIIGSNLVEWIWGGFAVSAPTLNRFYSLHFLTPMILAAVVFMHLMFLHSNKSSNSMGINSEMDKIQFHPYYSVKDSFFILVSISVLMCLAVTTPMLTLDPTNNIPANPMQTPVHIQPEWYFLSFYTILRALPSKTSGVLGLLSAVLVYLTMVIYKNKKSSKFNNYRKIMFWFYVSSMLILTKIGTLPAEEPYLIMGLIWSGVYFNSILLMNI